MVQSLQYKDATSEEASVISAELTTKRSREVIGLFVCTFTLLIFV